MFNPNLFLNSLPDGFGVLEIAQREEMGPYFVPLVKTEVSGEITGPLARLQTTQHYHFSSQTWSNAIEAVYRFPLSGDVAVIGATVTFGGVRIQAMLTTRKEAEARYRAAKEAGKQAALTTREAPDVFTLQVTGIRPDEDVRVEIQTVQLARAHGLDWSLRIPLTTAPRYVREDEGPTGPVQGQPLALLRDPGHRFALSLRLYGAEEFSSPTHELAVKTEKEPAAAGVQIELAGGQVVPDRDFVLRWQPQRAAKTPTLSLQAHVDRTDDAVYLLAAIAPPEEKPAATPAREVILLVDHSGSMHGPKWQAADWAIAAFLREMTPADSFALACFHNTVEWYGQAVQPADAAHVQATVAWLKEQKESGGTNLGAALEQALDLPPAVGAATRHVFIVTDAQVTDAGRILRLAEDATAGPAPRRISVLCIDAAPNDALTNEIVRRSGGIARYLTSDPQEEDITTALEEVLHAWAQPVLTNLRLAVDREMVTGSRRQASGPDGWAALDAGDLPAGQSIWLTARAPRADASAVTARLLAADDAVLAEAAVDLTRAPDHPALAALYGAARLNTLEYVARAQFQIADLVTELRKLGVNVQGLERPQRDKLYGENQLLAAAEMMNDLLAREALHYGLPSSATAFVAIREEAGNPISHTVPVANAVPHGWQLSRPGPSPAITQYAPSSPMLESQGRPLPQAGFMPMPAGGGFSGPSSPPRYTQIYCGVPRPEDGRALLYANALDVREVTLKGLRAARTGGDDPGDQAALLLYVSDLIEARARIRLRELLRQGERPLNVAVPAGAAVQLVLETADRRPWEGKLTIELAW